MSRVANETRLRLKEAAKEAGTYVSRGEEHPDRADEIRPLHVSTLVRWITKGVGGVKLEAVKLGGRWVTSREALRRFAERLTSRRGPEAPEPTPPAICRAGEVAESELARRGF